MDKMEKRFQRLCCEELTYLRGGVFRIVGNADDTDDVIQEALLRAYRRADSFRSESDLRSWVYRIAVNCAFDLLRDRKRQAEAGRQYAETAVQKGSIDETRLAALEHAVAELPVIYREAVVWGCLSDLSGSEAAARLGCTENTLYQRVFKAKQMLKKKMTQEEAR
ncbi:MAG: RNA polymerase sigma factor [Lentisphaeria bacterium]|nr:RNA polymerase sigma factor [Lentisphaeria bacterium]